MEFLVSIVTEVAKCLWVSIETQFNYLVYYKANIENLRSQVDDLEAKKKDVQNQVDESLRKLEEPNEEVCKWLKRMTEIEIASRNGIREVDENNKCLKGLCPNWCFRYRASKEAINKASIIKELLQKGKFDTVSCGLPPPSVIPTYSDYVEHFESIEQAMVQLMKALCEEDIGVIGVYGMQGVGKTTLMKRLNDELQKNLLFKKVIFVTVSNNLDLKIQDVIAERLGLKLDPKSSQAVRANKLYMRLKQEKNVLIILDEVWKRLEVLDIGIPNRNDHKGCKIILTSREESVCHQMGTQRNIKLELLSKGESIDSLQEERQPCS